MVSTRQPGKSGSKTPVEDRSRTNSQERDVSDAGEVDFSGPESEVEPQTCDDDVPIMTKGDFSS